MQPDQNNTPPTAQTQRPGPAASNFTATAAAASPAMRQLAMGGAEDGEGGQETDWLRRAQAAYRGSTSFADANYRRQWEDGIRAFNNKHPTDSKYNAIAYEKRSRLYRPKIRSVIRKNEASTAAAFFSNMETVSIAASDQSDQAQLVSADIMKQLIQYRLKHSIPWFQVVLGGIQDAQVVGAACAHVHWLYKAAPKVVTAVITDESVEVDEQPPQPPLLDKPAIDIVPIENCRFDPGASWIDVVNTSPYFIQLIPMYAMDVKAKMESGEWHAVSLRGARNAAPGGEGTRTARAGGGEDPQSGNTNEVQEYDIVWVQRHIHRQDDEDITFYTLDDTAMLSDPVPLKDVVFHGRRPYVIGNFVLETHKAMPAGVPALARGLEDETNEIANQRIDNVKFALNKKWFAKRGVDVDLNGLVRNTPGGVVMMNDPINDVREISFQDVTQSAFVEQQGLDMQMDELLGNFNPAQLMMNGAGNAPARNMSMLNGAQGTLVEYGIRTYVETFIQPILRQLVLLEQKYETDTVLMGIAAKNSKLFQRFGMDSVTDELLNQEITLTVDVGMGATDPSQKLQKFLAALTSYTNAMKNMVPGLNMKEVGKEIFGCLGYQDGSRFFTDVDPAVAQLQQQLAQAGQIMAEMKKKIDDKQTQMQVGLIKTRETNQTKLQQTALHEANENKRALATHFTALHKDANGTRTTV